MHNCYLINDLSTVYNFAEYHFKIWRKLILPEQFIVPRVLNLDRFNTCHQFICFYSN